ncbi:tetratricopeptide repeat protein [Spirosoma fluviale]|uniref:DNA-binding transcriptional regulator, CsgD family n=1 Tax=Spirosoma fluviale TaxID=1597977 RepID=A0A286GQL0_9BACT|nr:helix-turn-helix transcriptional regulator [Spirosoma fluviale]SOD97798.1 DNA-binding transcriptional regulator, CsgD family [Spirosoma fluviale]
MLIVRSFSTLFWVLFSLAALANPFLNRLEKATPANRIIIVLNQFDTCSVLTQNRANAFNMLTLVVSMGRKTGDDRLVRYCRFVKDTYDKHGTLSNIEKAAMFLTVGRRAEEANDEQIAAVCRHFAGEYYFLNNDYGRAFEHLLAANKTLRSMGIGQVPELSRYLFELAYNYYHVGDYETAIQLLHESARYPAYNPNLAIQTQNTLGMAYTQLSKVKGLKYTEKAEYFYRKARQTAAMYGDSLWIGLASGNLAHLYMQQRNWKAALAALQLDYTLGMKFGDKRILPNQTAVNMAAVYASRHQWDSCVYFLGQSMKLYRRNLTSTDFTSFGHTLRDEYYLKAYYDVARQYYRARGNLPRAYAYFDSLTILTDRISKRQNSRQVWLAEQTSLIQKHQSEVRVIEAEKNTQQLLFWSIGVGLVLVSGLFFLLYRSSKLRHRQETIINIEQERSLRLQKRIVEDELQQAKADLEVFVLNLHEKNALIDTITAELESLSQLQRRSHEQQQIAEAQQNLLDSSLLTNDDWDEFRRRFERVHPHFLRQLKIQFADISPAEERLLVLLKLGINTRQMSRMLGISPDSIRKTKYRMRKKLGADSSSYLIDLLAENFPEPSHS